MGHLPKNDISVIIPNLPGDYVICEWPLMTLGERFSHIPQKFLIYICLEITQVNMKLRN